MCLLCTHQVRNLNHALIGMDEIQHGKRSPDVEAIYFHTFSIESLFVSSSSRKWIGFLEWQDVLLRYVVISQEALLRTPQPTA